MVSQTNEIAGRTGGDGWDPDAFPTPDDTGEVELVWRCSECGYQRMAAQQPERCATCGASGDDLVGHTSVEWRVLLRGEAQQTSAD